MTASQIIKIHDIHGGVHPPENKEQSLRTPIQPAPIPEELVLPLSQHIGAPAKPVVAVGDHVLKGQMIAEAAGFVSVPIHAPTSGTITAIEDRIIPHPSGMSAPCMVLRCDGKDQWIAHQGVDDYQQLEKSELIDLIRNAGIAGMGGAGFPSAVKLNTRPNQVIDTLIINGTECEPYITADAILMRERADEIIAGARILKHIINPTEHVLIGVEDNKPEGIKALREAAQGSGIEIVEFPTKYPSGGEKQLIQILTGREVPAGGLPADIGIVCQNIGSTVAIYRAVAHGEPLISRITTVTGNAVQQQQNYEVLLGTPISTLLEASGFQPQKKQRLIMGGPMMGFALTSQAIPVVKTTNCILAPTEKEMPPPPPAQACIRCGMCAEACPVSLLPQQMYWYARAKDHEALQEHNLFDCIECGACSYVCPSNIPLVQYYRASKADIRHAEAEQKKAEYSKQRFEARQARLEKIEAEKEAKRRERQQRAAASGKQKTEKPAQKPAPATGSDDPVQAAIERAKAKAGKQETPAVASDDPVQAAIERAKARRTGADAGSEDPRGKLEKDIASLEKRLTASRDKLGQAEAEESATVDALKAACEKLESKLQKARQELAAFDDKPTEDKPAPATSDDPVQAAIERAKAKRAGTAADEDPKAKLEKDIASLEKRLAASREKQAQAEADGADTAEALKAGCEKMAAKLQKAKDELAALAGDKPAEEKTEPASSSDDPVQAAIERAKAKRAGKVDEDPKARLDNEIASLERRIANIEQKLGPEQGSDKGDALEVSLGKMQKKLADARAQREQLG